MGPGIDLSRAHIAAVWHDAAAAAPWLRPHKKGNCPVHLGMSEEQSFALAKVGCPALIAGALQVAIAQFKAIPKMAKVVQTGPGLGWHEHDASLLHGTGRFFRPGYAAVLWRPQREPLQ